MDKNKSFFLDIFNQLINYNEKQVMIIFDVDGNVWFKFVDLLRMLGYTTTIDYFERLGINKIFFKMLCHLIIPSSLTTSSNYPKTIFINESGLYQLLTKSTKPLAKQFLQKYLVLFKHIKTFMNCMKKYNFLKKVTCRLNRQVISYLPIFKFFI